MVSCWCWWCFCCCFLLFSQQYESSSAVYGNLLVLMLVLVLFVCFHSICESSWCSKCCSRAPQGSFKNILAHPYSQYRRTRRDDCCFCRCFFMHVWLMLLQYDTVRTPSTVDTGAQFSSTCWPTIVLSALGWMLLNRGDTQHQPLHRLFFTMNGCFRCRLININGTSWDCSSG